MSSAKNIYYFFKGSFTEMDFLKLNCFEITMTISTTWRVFMDFRIYMKQSDDYSMMARLQYLSLRIGFFVDDSFSNFFGG